MSALAANEAVTRRSALRNARRGSFGIGVYHAKTQANIGTLWRSAYQLGADFIFTIGRRYHKQSSDTYCTPRHVPLWEFASFDDLRTPHGHMVVGVEFGPGSKPITDFCHPTQCVYLLGAEDHGLPADIRAKCHALVSLPSVRTPSFNVAVAGSLVMYDRLMKGAR